MAPRVPVIRSKRDRLKSWFFRDEQDGTTGANRHLADRAPIDPAKKRNPIEQQEWKNLKGAIAGTLPPPKPTHHRYERYFIYVPPKARAKIKQNGAKLTKIKVAVFFGVWDQINRAGICEPFALRDDVALIQCPGIEENEVLPSTHWGCGIDSKLIEDLFDAAGCPNVDPDVHILAAYSTGYRGMQGTINGGWVSLRDVERVIWYDCLYQGTGYAPGYMTQDAVDNVLKDAPSCRFVVYEATAAGTKRYSGKLGANFSKATMTHIDLKSIGSVYSAFLMCRLLEQGVAGQFFTAADVPYLAAFQPLPTRLSLVSSQAAINAGVVKPSSGMLLADWGKQAHIVKALAQLDRQHAAETIFDHQLMGWVPTTNRQNPQAVLNSITAEMSHDQFVPEFCWEFLVPS